MKRNFCLKIHSRKLVVILNFLLSFLLLSCYVTRFNQIPVYETRSVPYTVKETRITTLPPLIPGDDHVVAFIRFAGGDIPTVEQVQENLKIGFQEQQSNIHNIVKRIKFINRAELLRSFTRSELGELGPDVERVLRSTFKVNIICTGTILSDNEYKLSIEVIDYRTNQIYNDIFIGNNWSSIGSEVAKAFFGTRTQTNYVDVTKYREEKYIARYRQEEYKENIGKEIFWEIVGTVLLGGMMIWMLSMLV